VVQQRLPSLLTEPIGFAHRGARAHAPENTLEAFELALKLGATGLESDVWLTSDDVVVLDHDGTVGRRRRRRSISELRRDELPAHIPALADLLAAVGIGYHLSLDIKQPGIGQRVIDTVAAVAPELLPRLWLCSPSIDELVALREPNPTVKLVNSTRLNRMERGPERRAANLAELRIDAVNLHHTDWNGGLVALFHRFERFTLAWDLQFEHVLRSAIRMGIDGVFSDHVDLMVDALAAEAGA
jgi:glycerophosphoryl diester phosphodiesterase